MYFVKFFNIQPIFITFKCDFVLWKIKIDSLADYQNTANTSKISKIFTNLFKNYLLFISVIIIFLSLFHVCSIQRPFQFTYLFYNLPDITITFSITTIKLLFNYYRLNAINFLNIYAYFLLSDRCLAQTL